MQKINPVIIELKPSTIMKNEVGLFAAKSIKKDNIIINAKAFSDERLISWDEYKSLDKLTQRKIMDFCCGRDEGFYAPKDLNLISIAWHMNHSCEPNVGFDSKYNFVAVRNIKKGEELFWDYCYDETNPKFKLNCICGTKSCRGKISGNDWKKAAALNFKTHYLSPHVKKLIKQKS
jgi:SET domain-containing protein